MYASSKQLTIIVTLRSLHKLVTRCLISPAVGYLPYMVYIVFVEICMYALYICLSGKGVYVVDVYITIPVHALHDAGSCYRRDV